MLQLTNLEREVMLYRRQGKMLAAVAHHAAENGDYLLAGRIWGFTHYWNSAIAPQLSKADWVEVLMSPSGAAAETEFASIAFHSLAQVPASQVILAMSRDPLMLERSFSLPPHS
jgi:hypothetical protein